MGFNKVPLKDESHSVRAAQIVLQYGVGAMLDFPDQTLMTAAPEFWEESTENIFDVRLQALLGVDCFKVPAGTDTIEGKTGISYVRFPEWYFCPKCRKFQPLKGWIQEYREKAKFAESDPDMVKHMKCTSCSQNLVVTRIVTCCEDGHINDFPWVEWVHYNNMGGMKRLCSHPKLKIRTGSSSSEGLEGIIIECTSCNAKSSLKGAFGKNDNNRSVFEELDDKHQVNLFRCKGGHPWKSNKPEKCSKYPKTMQRGSSSVYFPVTYSSIVIPPYSTRMKDRIHKSKAFEEALTAIKNAPLESKIQIIQIFINNWVKNIANETGIKENFIKDYLGELWNNGNCAGQDLDKTRYKFEEYDALLGIIGKGAQSNDFEIEIMKAEDYGVKAVKNITLVHKIKEVQALLGFTRQKPYEVNEKTDEKSYVSIKAENTRWYPAYEVRGEGIFIELDNDLIQAWAKNDVDIKNRADDMNSNYLNSYYGESRPRIISSKFVLLHTLAHLLIRELSFESGYSIASIKERIYCCDSEEGKTMSGILLYTASGDSEGTLGGLVRQGRNDHFPKIFVKAIETALVCSNDPVCILSKGQGRDSLNLGACHSCTLLPETSCEEFNIFLDRGMLIGTFDNKSMGFFRNMLFGEPEWVASPQHDFKDIDKSSSFKLKNKGTEFARGIAEVIDYVIDTVTEDFETEKLNELKEKLFIANLEVLPYAMSVLMDLFDGQLYDVDLLWIEKNIGICFFDNEEAYSKLKNSNWNIYYLDKEFDCNKLLKALKEN